MRVIRLGCLLSRDFLEYYSHWWKIGLIAICFIAIDIVVAIWSETVPCDFWNNLPPYIIPLEIVILFSLILYRIFHEPYLREKWEQTKVKDDDKNSLLRPSQK